MPASASRSQGDGDSLQGRPPARGSRRAHGPHRPPAHHEHRRPHAPCEDIKTKAKLTADKVFDANPVAVTVSRNETKARVFRRGKLVETYTVAVGSAEFPTPTGQFVVQTMQKNPSWNVQLRVGGLARGPDDPGWSAEQPARGALIGFNGSVGFHGTASSGSLGSAASHGCIRMAPNDVIDLFTRVKLGTPVLVA